MQALLEDEGVEIKNNQIVDLKKYLQGAKECFVVFASKIIALSNFHIVTLAH